MSKKSVARDVSFGIAELVTIAIASTVTNSKIMAATFEFAFGMMVLSASGGTRCRITFGFVLGLTRVFIPHLPLIILQFGHRLLLGVELMLMLIAELVVVLGVVPQCRKA